MEKGEYNLKSCLWVANFSQLFINYTCQAGGRKFMKY